MTSYDVYHVAQDRNKKKKLNPRMWRYRLLMIESKSVLSIDYDDGAKARASAYELLQGLGNWGINRNMLNTAKTKSICGSYTRLSASGTEMTQGFWSITAYR